MLVQFGNNGIQKFKNFLWQSNWTRPKAWSSFRCPRNFSMNAKFLQDNSQFPFDSTKIRGHFNEISRRIFFEFSRNKERKSANFAFISFVQYCKFNLGDDVFETIRTQLVSIDLLKNIENQIILTIWWTGKRAHGKKRSRTLWRGRPTFITLHFDSFIITLQFSLL